MKSGENWSSISEKMTLKRLHKFIHVYSQGQRYITLVGGVGGAKFGFVTKFFYNVNHTCHKKVKCHPRIII